MATLLIGDIAYGEIEFRRRTYPTGKFTVQSGVTVSEGDLIDIIGNYTTNGGTSSTTLYKGRIVNRSFEKVKTITTESEAEELDKVRPQARYSGTLGGLIQDLAREEFNFLSMTLSAASSPYMYRSPHNFKGVTNGTFPPLEHTPYGWIDYSGGAGTKHAYVIASQNGHQKVLELYSNDTASWAAARYEWAYEQEVSVCNYDIWVATNTNTKQFELRLGNFYHSPVYDGVYLRFDTDGKIYYRDGYSPDTWVDSGETYAANTYYRLTFYLDGEANKWALDINGVNKLTDIDVVGDLSTYFIEGIHITTAISGHTGQYVWIDAPGFDQDKITYEQNYTLETNQYYEMDQLNYDTGFMKYILAGDMTLRQYFDMYADQYLYTWYLKPDYELLFNDGAVDSGVNLSSTSNVKNIDGKKQIKNFDKVILLGGFVGGQQLEASYGAGNVIVKDTYAGITDYDVLLSMAEEIYNQKTGNPLSVALDYLNLTEGYIQVGEEVTIIGNTFRFKRSDEYICTSDTQFKLKGVKVYIIDGQLEHIELFLEDVLVFEVRGVDEDLPIQNSTLINQVGSGGISTAAGGGGGGESNSMINIGSAGVGVYKQKTGTQFEMKNINAGSNKITITDDTGNDEIDIDVDLDGYVAPIDGINSDGGDFDFLTSGVLNLKTSGQTSKYLQVYTATRGNLSPILRAMGTTNQIVIESTSTVDNKILFWNTDITDLFEIGIDKTANIAFLRTPMDTLEMRAGFESLVFDGAVNDILKIYPKAAGVDISIIPTGDLILGAVGGNIDVQESMTLASAKIIDSADEDLVFTFGKGKMGYITANDFIIAHRTFFNGTGFALKQIGTGGSAGRTVINAPVADSVYFNTGNVQRARINSNALFLSVPITMGSNKITGLATPSAAGDALRFENISDLVYDGTAWNNITDIAPSKNAVRDIIDPLTSAMRYSGLWTPGTDKYPEAQTDGTVGSTAGTSVFTDATKDFTALGVLAGDILNIREGVDLGFYVIDVVGTTTITCTGDTFGTVSNLEYQIFRAIGGEYWICDADGEYDSVWYEVGDWLVWNDTELQWDRIRNSFGDNIITVALGDNIQNAIDEIEAVGGGTVFLMPGTHVLTATLTINSVSVDIAITGSYNASVIDLGADRSAFSISNAQSCILENFKIDASDLTSTTRAVISINEVSDNRVIIDNITIDATGAGDKGRGIEVITDNAIIRDCTFIDLYYGIYTGGAIDGLVSGCTAYNCYGGMYAGDSYWIISDNIFRDNTNYGIFIEGGFYNNISSNNLHSNGVNGIYILNSHSNRIISNGLHDNGGDAIYGDNCDWTMFSGNNNANTGVDSASHVASIHLTNSDENVIIGNVFARNANSGVGEYYSIWIDNANCDRNVIGINQITGDVIVDVGTDTIIIADDTAYAASWNGDLGTPTKNAVYDKIELSDAALMIGAANAAYIPCLFEMSTLTTWNFKEVSGTYENINATDAYWTFGLPLPTNRGGKKLYINGARIDIFDSDPGDYVNTILIRANDHDSLTVIASLDHYGINGTGIGQFDYSFTAVDVSAFSRIFASLMVVLTNAGDLNIVGIGLRCYYDT